MASNTLFFVLVVNIASAGQRLYKSATERTPLVAACAYVLGKVFVMSWSPLEFHAAFYAATGATELFVLLAALFSGGKRFSLAKALCFAAACVDASTVSLAAASSYPWLSSERTAMSNVASVWHVACVSLLPLVWWRGVRDAPDGKSR